MAVHPYQGLQYQQGAFQSVEDILAVEQSLSISINGKPYSITMRTPGSDVELLRGILFSEQIFTDRESDPQMDVLMRDAFGYITSMNVILPEQQIERRFEGARNVMSVSSCGICGKTELENLSGSGALLNSVPLEASKVSRMFDIMSQQQNTFKASGGSHAAAAFDADAKLLAMDEDIGRHNAVDKVVGKLLMERKLNQAICLIVSGRISYEIISKQYQAGIPFLAAVSAPSSLAVDYSKELGLTLMAFCRNNRLTVYSHPERLIA